MQVFSNYASTQIIAGISDIDTAFTVLTTEGGLFNAIGVEEFELLTLTDGTYWEVVQVIDRVVDTFTVVRGHEGVPRAWLAGTIVKSSVTKDTLERMLQRDEVGASFALFAYQNYR